MEEEKAVDVRLPLTDGMTVEVLTMENQITFVGKVVSYTGGVLTVRKATDGELPPALYNREIKLHFFHGENNIILHGNVCGSTKWLWKIERLERQFDLEKRSFFRQNVKLDAKVQCIARVEETLEQGEENEEAPAPCRILDASANGLRLSSRIPFQTGDRLLVTDLAITPGEKPFVLRCCVKRVVREGGNCVCGCQIEDLSEREQDRLLQAVFMVQRKARQEEKERF